MTTTRASLEQQLDVITKRLAAFDTLPAEPDVEDGEPAVITFSLRFKSSQRKACLYAAVRCTDNGYWYLSGPNPRPFRWEQLCEWLLIDNFVVDGIWLATEFEQLV